MITFPKPKFAETSVPIGQSKHDYKEEIIEMQSHVLNDAIDRVSFRKIIQVLYVPSMILVYLLLIHLVGASDLGVWSRRMSLVG